MLRVLSLHGFATNSDILLYQLKSSSWNARFSETASFHPVNGPLQVTGLPDLQRISPGPYHAWWNAQQRPDGTFSYSKWRESINYLSDFVKQHGPFDGLLGFSQGACLASIIIALQQHGMQEVKDFPIFKFAIFVAGFCSRSTDHEELYSEPISCKSLHIYGEEDGIKQSSQLLAQKYVDPVVMVHPSGHRFPQLNDQNEQIIKHFLTSSASLSKL